MECDTKLNSQNVQQTMELRLQAVDLLNRLIADREQSERRLAEAGKRDPMKFITGRTAFDDAIVAAREMIANMDNLLAGMTAHDESGANGALPHVHTIRFPSAKPARSGHANGKSSATNGVRAARSATITT